MKTLLLVFLLQFSVQTNLAPVPMLPATYVYVCENGKTEVYHLGSCSALNRCKHQVSKITLADAKARGLRVCGTCR